MISVYILCEGRTESSFVQNVLAPALGQKSIFLYPFQIGRRRRGGNVSFERLLPSIRAQLHSNQYAYCTSLFDYYGLPPEFPGKESAATMPILAEKAETVCNELVARLGCSIDIEPLQRFIPYVQMHEFEGLLFSDPSKLAIELRRQDLTHKLWAIRHDFETPEHIDDSPVSAPSKRIQQIFPRYRKVQMGERAARAITLKKIRQACPLFDAWLRKLENLPLLD